MIRTQKQADDLTFIVFREKKDLGEKFKSGAFDAISQAFQFLDEADEIAFVIDQYIVPKGIEMPWGIRVVP